MRGFSTRAIVLSVLFLLASQFHFITPSLNEDTQRFFTSQEVITSTEVRVHNLGGDWNENQVLQWSPNHLEYNRTIQFSIFIEGINSIESIQSLTLNMTWIHNVSSGDSLLSENLSKSDLIPHENGLFMYFIYTYPLDIFHDEYNISLDTIDSDGVIHAFEHKGINVIAYDMHLEPISIDYDDKLLFANNQVTSLELFIQNTGSVYTDIEFEIIFNTRLPSNWNSPDFFISNSTLKGGENSIALFEFQAPDDAFPSKDPMPAIVFQLIAEFEDFTGQMVEFYNANYSLESELVPFNSNANISAYRTNFSTDLIRNNYEAIDSNIDILESSLISFENNSIDFFFDLQNYGFSQTTFELEVFSLNSIEFEVYSSTNNEKILDLASEEGNIRDIAPFDIVSFRCHINFIPENEITKEPISIIITNSLSGEQFDLEIPIYVLEINNILTPILDLDSFEVSNNTSLLQNDSVSLYLAMHWQPLFEISYFQNNWKMSLSIVNSNSVIEPQIEFDLLQNNSSLPVPYNFAIFDNQFFKVIIDVGKDTAVGDYSININIEQITNDTNNKQNFETQYQLTVLENSSLTEPSQNNSNNNSTIDDSNNSSIDNSTTSNTNNSSNSTGNNNQNPIDNTTNVTQQNNDNNTQGQNIESDEAADSKNSESKSWLFVGLALIVISLISVIIIRRKIDTGKKNFEEMTDKTIVEINTPTIPATPMEAINSGDLTVLRQWTDNNGYTWRQMSDRSMLWWNGQHWVPVN